MIFLTKNPIWGGGGGGGGGGVFFYKLIRNPNLTIFLCLCVEGGGGRVMYMHEQMFQMARLLFKENTCAKLFLKSMHICRSYGPEKLIYVTFKCDLDLQPT